MVYHYSFWCWLCGCLCSWCCKLDSNSALNLRGVLRFRRFFILCSFPGFVQPAFSQISQQQQCTSEDAVLQREVWNTHQMSAFALTNQFWSIDFFFNTCHFIFQHLHFYFHFLWLAKFDSKPINVKLPDLHIWFLNSLISRKSFSSHTKIFEKVLVNSISDKFYHHLLKSNFFVNRYTLLY